MPHQHQRACRASYHRDGHRPPNLQAHLTDFLYVCIPLLNRGGNVCIAFALRLPLAPGMSKWAPAGPHSDTCLASHCKFITCDDISNLAPEPSYNYSDVVPTTRVDGSPPRPAPQPSQRRMLCISICHPCCRTFCKCC